MYEFHSNLYPDMMVIGESMGKQVPGLGRRREKPVRDYFDDATSYASTGYRWTA